MYGDPMKYIKNSPVHLINRIWDSSTSKTFRIVALMFDTKQ